MSGKNFEDNYNVYSDRSSDRLDDDWRSTTRLFLAGSAISSVVASGFATVAANLPSDQGVEPRYELASINNRVLNRDYNTEVSVGGIDLSPGEDIFRLPGLRIDEYSVETTKTGSFEFKEINSISIETEKRELPDVVVSMEWARLFAADPEASRIPDGGKIQIDSIVRSVDEFIKAGYIVDSLDFQGHASDEDDTTHLTGRPGAGLNVDNPKNVELANKRADTVVEEVLDALAKVNLDTQVGQLNILEGIEVRDTELNEAIFRLSEDRRESTNDVIMSWNRGYGNFTEAELDVIDGLADDRYVSVVANLRKEEISKTIDEIWVEGPDKISKTSTGGSIALVPILIPPLPGLGGRRRKFLPIPVAPIEPPKYSVDTPIYHGQYTQNGYVSPTHKQPTAHRKQPSQWNNGSNSGPRGQRQIRIIRDGQGRANRRPN